MTDTHCHLNFPEYEKDIDEVIKRSVAAGVTKIIIPGADLKSSKKAVEIAQKYKECYATVGIHPHHAGDCYDDLNHCNKDDSVDKNEKNHNEFCRDALQCVSTLREMAQQPKVVAIGETGLDYHQFPVFPAITEEIKQKQKELFSTQIKIAEDLNLPLIIHCREAWEDILDIITKYIISRGVMHYAPTSRSSNNKLRGVFHCYAGGKKWLKKALDLGFYIGIDGNVTYDEGLQNVVKEIPLDRLLLETDSPYLTPVPFRGQRNEPKNIKLIAEKITEIKNISINELSLQIEKNYRRIFIK
jgi:TatD DNase family protein